MRPAARLVLEWHGSIFNGALAEKNCSCWLRSDWASILQSVHFATSFGAVFVESLLQGLVTEDGHWNHHSGCPSIAMARTRMIFKIF